MDNSNDSLRKMLESQGWTFLNYEPAEGKEQEEEIAQKYRSWGNKKVWILKSYTPAGTIDPVKKIVFGKTELSIDDKIEDFIKECNYHLRNVRKTEGNPEFFQYTYPNIQITNIRTLENGKKIADITADIQREPAIYPLSNPYPSQKKEAIYLQKLTDGTEIGYFPIKEIHQYLNISVEKLLKNLSVPLEQKAIALLEFRDNIDKNYDEKGIALINTINDFYKEIFRIMPADEAPTKFIINKELLPNTIKESDAELKDKNLVKILNLNKGLFLDAKNQEKIRKHAREGQFDKKIPLQLTIIRQVEYE